MSYKKTRNPARFAEACAQRKTDPSAPNSDTNVARAENNLKIADGL